MTTVVASGTLAVVLMLCFCLGGWVFFGPVNYFGCDAERPDGITESDLIGTYGRADGARLELRADGTLYATALMQGDQSLTGPGTWRLQPPDAYDDINLTVNAGTLNGGYLEISGTRSDPWLYWYEIDPDICRLYRLDRQRP